MGRVGKTLSCNAMDAKIVIPSILLILMCSPENSSCIQCFQCNSGDDARCEDPFSFQDMAEEYLYHCPDNENGKEYFCQKMLYKDRVQRSCQHIIRMRVK